MLNTNPKELLFLSRPRANFAIDMNKIPFFAAILALLGVGLGAFGAHGLEDLLIKKTEKKWYKIEKAFEDEVKQRKNRY